MGRVGFFNSMNILKFNLFKEIKNSFLFTEKNKHLACFYDIERRIRLLNLI